jgi:hypothetical protein
MSIDRISLIKAMGVVLIAVYIALALSFVPDLLPGSAMGILMTGSRER